MGWGGLCPFWKKYLDLICVTSIEIKIEVQASWLLYILYSPPIFKNKRCYVHANHLCLQITNYLMNPGQLYQNMWTTLHLCLPRHRTLSFSWGHIRVCCKCTSKTLNNYEGFLINYANTAIDIYECEQRTITFYWDII